MTGIPKLRLRGVAALLIALCLTLGLMPGGALAADTITGAKVREIVGVDGKLTGKFAGTGQAAQDGELAAFTSYAEFFQTLQAQGQFKDEPYVEGAEGISVVIPKTSGDADNAFIIGDGFSATNTRTKGIDEPDMIKTDGKYIYTVDSRAGVTIVDAASMKIVKTIVSARQGGPATETEHFRGVMISGNMMVITSAVYFNDTKTAPAPGTYASYYVYDIANPSAPALVRSVRVKGAPVETRLVGGTLFSTVRDYINYFSYDSPAIQVLPLVQDSVMDNAYRPLEPGNIWRVAGQKVDQYMNIVSFPIGSKEKASVRCEAAAAGFSYMSPNALYMIRNAPNAGVSERVETMLTRYALSAGMPLTGSADVPGNVINEYALDEHNGNLRLATTEASGSNVLVYDSSLRQVGSVRNLAKGENIQAVRFMGDAGYVVTYRNVDPLFTLDLSNPAKPRVLGQLKIPGFSSYLHPFGTNYLVGLGRETAELSYVNDSGKRVTSDNVQDLGLKVSLFDVSKPASPKEVAKAIVGGPNSYTDAANNPRSILVDESLGLFAFTGNIDPSGSDASQLLPGGETAAFCGVIMNVAPPKLSVKGYIKTSGNNNFQDARFCRVGGGLFFLVDNLLEKYDLGSLAKLESVKLR